MKSKPGRTSQGMNKIKDKLISGRTQLGDKGSVYHCAGGTL